MKISDLDIQREAFFPSNGPDPGVVNYEVATYDTYLGLMRSYRLTTNYSENTKTWAVAYDDGYGDEFKDITQEDVPEVVANLLSDAHFRGTGSIPRPSRDNSPDQFRAAYRGAHG